MLLQEAAIIQGMIDVVSPKSILDCGSGNKADRTIFQPQIAAAFAGYDVRWTDLVNGHDFTKPETLVDLPRCELVTCCSLLEHVVDIPTALKAVCDLADEWVLISVPWHYPEHHCPIDNMWRPSPDDLAGEISAMGFTVVDRCASGQENFQGVENASASIVLARRK